VSHIPSGEQFELRHGAQRATIVEVGAGIREYAVDDRDVLEPYPREAICDGGHGAVLVPWPNRLGGGRYSWEGVERQLDLSEPTRGNAIHGLMRWRSWQALERSTASVAMGAMLRPHPGYPFALELRLLYALADDGLTVACTARNVGVHACPYGFGQHPYLYAGGGPIDACELELAAASAIVLDDSSRLPVGAREVRDSPLDFNAPTRIGERVLDDALTGFASPPRAVLTCPDGARIELWADERHHVLQVFSGDTLAAGRRRRALAVEPMTCPPDAFRSGEHLIRLEPGESVTTRWGVRRLS
jgi:aldose 1-epimerase